MATNGQIRTIVFDVGWVLVTLDYSRLTQFLREHGADVADMRQIVARIELERHETGQLPGTDLLDNLARLGTRSIDLAQLRTHWDDMFELQMPMVRLAERLTERYRVHLLSNVGDLHWIHLAREFRLHRLGHGALPSFVAGVMKPDPEIYAQAERRFDLEPQATVFIDDLPANVEAARARGWHGVQHRSFEETSAALQALGVAA
jgi:FMN phosphatase YigB (HAD superfamily)